MTNREVNEVISEYMGIIGINRSLHFKPMFAYESDYENYSLDELDKNNLVFEQILYTSSLDALVPVWIEMPEADYHIYNSINSGKYLFHIDNYIECRDSEYEGKTIQEAAAYATCLAILALKEK